MTKLMKSIEFRLLLVFLLLITGDVVHEMIKSNLYATQIVSKMIVRGSTLFLAWIFIKYLK